MRHLDAESLRCTNHRKWICWGKESHLEFCCLKQALFFFTFPSNPWLLEGERTRTFWALLLLLEHCGTFQRQIWWLYLKNVHTLQHDRTCKPQGLCDALNPPHQKKPNSSACEWVQVVVISLSTVNSSPELWVNVSPFCTTVHTHAELKRQNWDELRRPAPFVNEQQKKNTYHVRLCWVSDVLGLWSSLGKHTHTRLIPQTGKWNQIIIQNSPLLSKTPFSKKKRILSPLVIK